MTHITIKNFFFLHEELDYNQMYNFVLTIMTNFEPF
jgi:hypothetical protein